MKVTNYKGEKNGMMKQRYVPHKFRPTREAKDGYASQFSKHLNFIDMLS